MNIVIPVGGGKRVVTGSFTGNGSETISISVDFSPTGVCIILNGSYAAANMTTMVGLTGGVKGAGYRASDGTTFFGTACTFTYSAGSLSVYSGGSSYYFTSGKTYQYVLTE